MTFLVQRDPRPLLRSGPDHFVPVGLFLGAGPMPLEVAVYQSPRRPSNPDLRELHQSRTGKRAATVVVVALWGEDRAGMAGPGAGELVVVNDTDRTQTERILEAALAAADRHAALRLLGVAFDQLNTPLPGVRNAGLFAYHELQAGVPTRADWTAANEKCRALLRVRGRTLIQQLGFGVQELPGPASILVAHQTKVAVAVFLERPDEIEPTSPRFDGLSPISYALAKADQENLDYIVVSAGSALRVYPVKPGVGTGRRGRTETWIELNLDLLAPDQAGYLWLLASADALRPEGLFTDILTKSADYAAELGGRLRERVYEDVVPGLAAALVKARGLRKPTAETLSETYEMALLVLFRLLFVAYAEDKELLPLHASRAYQEHSLKEIAKRLARQRSEGTPFERESFYWTEVTQLWKAVDRGNRSWRVPAYNGGLFATDRDAAPLGAALEEVSLPDDAFGPALASLLLDDIGDGIHGPIDFRSLGVREFGTVYEGLLASELSVAETDLAVNPKNLAYEPAKGKATVVVQKGEVYLHNASGARKSTGAYYTKDFAVEHLLDHALEPALSDHLARLDALGDPEAAERFFEFRVADIAMGSGHFLVAAVDRIERRLSSYLARRSLAGVRDELERLRQTARAALGEDWSGDPIEDTQLLRRQISRRCIFGVDLNPLAVELARLSLWIHTFVPGLPLSFLDGNLVAGNSLVGIATLDEVREALGAGLGLFEVSADELLGRIRPIAARLGRLAEADAAEVKEARKLHQELRKKIRHVEGLFSIVAASRTSGELRQKLDSAIVGKLSLDKGDAFTDALVGKAEEVLAGLRPFHFPVAFPQVFLGARQGFDVIIGNPPWEKARVEEHEFWARHFPGLRGLAAAERDNETTRLRHSRPDLIGALEREKRSAEAFRNLVRDFPGMATGHPDLFRAFTWRFVQLICREGGEIGIVLPGDAFKIKGGRPLREAIVGAFPRLDIQLLTNKAEWVFEDVHAQKLICLLTGQASPAGHSSEYVLRPEIHTRRDWRHREKLGAAHVDLDWLRAYSPGLVVPTITTASSMPVLEKMMKSPRLAAHESFPVARVYADFETTRDKARWQAEFEYGCWPVYKGESFDLWTPDTRTYFAWTQGEPIAHAIHERRQRAPKGSPYSRTQADWREDPATHPALLPRIAFRDVTNRTNTRTLVATLIPPRVVTTQSAPWVLWYATEERERREALLLGFMSSIPVDWWMRRFVEGHCDEEAFNRLPIPIVSIEASIERRIISIAGKLAARDERFERWAEAVGVTCGNVSEPEFQDSIAELDAAVAHLYGLSEADLVHIFETFHEGWDYQARLDATLRHFTHLKGLAR